MLIGQTLILLPAGDSYVECLGTWMPRQGDAATFTLEVLNFGADNSGNPRIVLDILEKNLDDTGGGSAKSVVAGSNARTGVGLATFRVDTCKELVRYRVRLSTQGVPIGSWVAHAHFRVLSPSWEVTGA